MCSVVHKFFLFGGLALSLITCTNSSKNYSDFTKSIEVDSTYFKHSQLLKYSKIDSSTAAIYILSPWIKGDTLQKIVIGKTANLFPSDYTKIPKKIERATVLSTVYVGFLDMLNAANSILAVDNTEVICSQRVQDLVKKNRITALSDANSVKIEKIHQLNSDLILFSKYNKVVHPLRLKAQKLNISSIACVEYLEKTPLARAEWIKLFGILVGKEQEAVSLFNMVDEHYTDLALWAQKLDNKPSVFTGNFFVNSWYVSGARSNQARLINDAGGKYVWTNLIHVGSIPLSFEQVYLNAKDADIWLNCGQSKSKNKLLDENKKYQLFESFKNNKIWNYYNKQSLNNKGSLYWETGTVRPDLVLKDLVKIFHPSKMEGHSFIFYKDLK